MKRYFKHFSNIEENDTAKARTSTTKYRTKEIISCILDLFFLPRNRVLVNCTMITATSCGSDASIEDSKWKVGSATIIYSTFV